MDWEEYNPPLYRAEWGRVLRSPLKSTGHVTLDLCLPSGEVARNVLSKSNVVHVPSLYTALRKTTWGGLFPVLQGDTFHSPLTMEKKGVGQSPFLPAPPLSEEEEQKRREGGRRRLPSQGGPDRGGDGGFRHVPPAAQAGRATATATHGRSASPVAARPTAAKSSTSGSTVPASAPAPAVRGRIRPAIARRRTRSSDE